MYGLDEDTVRARTASSHDISPPPLRRKHHLADRSRIVLLFFSPAPVASTLLVRVRPEAVLHVLSTRLFYVWLSLAVLQLQDAYKAPVPVQT